LFDEYSLAILEQNSNNIKGFKIQASVLGNFSLFEKLYSLDLRGKSCILNVSGYELEEVEPILNDLKTKFSVEFILQAGFQSHPTEFMDSGLSKIETLKKQFPGMRLSYTDHLHHDSKDILVLPFLSSVIGAEIVEKHIKAEHLETLYDHYSSINHLQFRELFEMSARYEDLLKQPYINEKERQYLKSSLQVPVLKADKQAGQILNASDFYYRRTSKQGLDSFEIKRHTANFSVLIKDLPAGSAVQKADLKRARIGAAVVCRMKSARLPKKATLKVGKISSVELAIKNTLDFENVDEVILATSTHPDDAVLKDFTYSDKVKFFAGSENDVIERLIKLADLYQLDILIRITADSPYRSNDVLQKLLKSHFEKGADYSALINAPMGTNTEVMNVQALKTIYRIFNGTPYSEYMSFYFKNNPQFFNLNLIELDKQYTNEYRLTLDYPEDLDLFQAIEKQFDHSINKFDPLKLYQYLRENPKIASINQHCEIAYKPDSELMKKISDATTYKA
jgi:spore coat polysaccharide biosynthesis protein SpsF (cytidylyltransferase family)/sialic acid synthase SpsE